MSIPESPAVRDLDVLRMDAAEGLERGRDRVAVEAPLEVQLHGEPFSVIMRTPGTDAELAIGFLFTEGVVRTLADVAGLEQSPAGDAVNVTLAPDRALSLPDWLGSRRQVTMNSSCGMCGRRTLESLDIDAPPLPVAWTIPTAHIAALPAALRARQRAFSETGGLHAAGLFRRDGGLEAVAEDVGRHNAVDKLLGRMLMMGRLPLTASLLFVSGRSSFEIVQKAFLGGIPLVAAVSAPSSLAVDLADRCGMTLLGFVRDGRFNVYSHQERLTAYGSRLTHKPRGR
jgi:FdhD protein